MKMQEVNMELLAFDSTDVITTSTEDVDDSAVSVIWLTPQSVQNYNNLYNDDINLRIPVSDTNVIWYSYGGTYEQEFNMWWFAGRKYTGEDDPTEGIRTVDKNGDGYAEVSAWLKKNKK